MLDTPLEKEKQGNTTDSYDLSRVKRKNQNQVKFFRGRNAKKTIAEIQNFVFLKSGAEFS